MGFLSGIAGKLVIGAIVISLLVVYYYKTQSTIATLEKNIVTHKVNEGKLNNAIDIQHNTIEQMKKDYIKIEKSKDKIRLQKRISEQKIIVLNKKLTKTKTGKKRDLTKIARRKTKLFEKIINRGSLYRNRCFEIASGSKLTEADKKNTVCKDLVSPNE